MPFWIARGTTSYADDWQRQVQADNLREARRAVMADRKTAAQDVALRLTEIDIEDMQRVGENVPTVRALYEGYRVAEITDQGARWMLVNLASHPDEAGSAMMVIQDSTGFVLMVVPTTLIEVAVAQWNEQQERLT